MDPALAQLRERSLRNPSASVREWWWCSDEALALLAARLAQNRFAIIDGFLPLSDALKLSDQVKAAERDGHLSISGAVGGGRRGRDGSATIDTSVRGDILGYFDGDETPFLESNSGNNSSLLSRTLEKVNTLVCELRDLNPVAVNEVLAKPASAIDGSMVARELKCISTRSRAMITCYKGSSSAFYSRHVDNPTGNGRKLTTILYLNKEWEDSFGGGLTMFPPSQQDQYSQYFSQKEVVISPILNRLLLFWSDHRCPHGVLPVTAPERSRFAVTIWFIDSKEKQRALELEPVLSESNNNESQSASAVSETLPSPPPPPSASTIHAPDIGESSSFTWSLSHSSDGLEINIQFLGAGAWERRAELELDVNESLVRLKFPFDQPQSSLEIVHPEGKALEKQSAKAKFNKKQMSLKISVSCI